MEIGEMIKNARIKADLTQTELANLLGVNVGSVSRWESGDVQNMKRDKIAKLSRVLGIPLENLMGWEVPQDEAQIKRLLAYYNAFSDNKKKDLLNYAEYINSKKED